MIEAQSYLKQHMVSLHGICIPQTREGNEKGDIPTTYVVYFPRVLQLVRCPVPGCPAVAHSLGSMCEHFMFQHFRSRIVVVQEGNEPLPRCDLCGMHIPEGGVIKNRRMAQCDQNTQIRWRRRYVEIAAKCMGATFSIIGEDGLECSEGVEFFKYWDRVLP